MPPLTYKFHIKIFHHTFLYEFVPEIALDIRLLFKRHSNVIFVLIFAKMRKRCTLFFIAQPIFNQIYYLYFMWRVSFLRAYGSVKYCCPMDRIRNAKEMLNYHFYSFVYLHVCFYGTNTCMEFSRRAFYWSNIPGNIKFQWKRHFFWLSMSNKLITR